MSEDNYLTMKNVEVEDGRTTIKLEDCFWEMLLEISCRERTTVSALIKEIDKVRGPQHPRASAIRVYVLKYYCTSETEINIKSVHPAASIREKPSRARQLSPGNGPSTVQ